MKKILSTLLIVLFAAACTPIAQPQNGMMSDQCPCCKMMEGGKMQCPMMKSDAKDGMKCCCCSKKQCPIMQGKDGKQRSCCQKMMKNMKKDDSQSEDVSAEDHAKHHPAQ